MALTIEMLQTKLATAEIKHEGETARITFDVCKQSEDAAKYPTTDMAEADAVVIMRNRLANCIVSWDIEDSKGKIMDVKKGIEMLPSVMIWAISYVIMEATSVDFLK